MSPKGLELLLLLRCARLPQSADSVFVEELLVRH
jgi:hypothetical protein